MFFKSNHSKKTKTIIIVITMTTMLLAIANIVASNAVATTGKKLQAVNQRVEELKAQNQELETQIAEKKSLHTIAIRAQELGMKAIENTLSLSTPAPIAQAP